VRWKAGDQDALEALLPLVYKELRDIARYHLQRERPGHTLQSAASRLMRQILVDHARSHGAAKRGADRRVELDASLVLPQVRSTDVVALDDALTDLARLDEQQSRIVELRFFGGLSNEEIAEVLGISVSTVKRDWNVAKAWLTREMKKGNRGDTRAVAKN